MNAILKYMESFFALFLILKLLIHMVPKEDFQKYIRFFAEIVLAFGLLSPILRYIGDEEAFLNMVEYNEFAEGLKEASLGAERIEFMQNDYYVRQYEEVIELDVAAQAEQYGFAVKEVSVSLSDYYEIESISLVITDQEQSQNQSQGEKNIIIRKISLEEEKGNTEDTSYQKLKEMMLGYYQLTESQLAILYE